MEVVAHRIGICELRKVRRIALRDVVKAHGDRAFMVDVRLRLWRAVAAGGDCRLNPREKIKPTSARIVLGGSSDIAIELLPHLIEAVDGTAGVGVIAGVR